MQTRLLNQKTMNVLSTLPIGDDMTKFSKDRAPMKAWTYCSDGSCRGDCVGDCTGTAAGHSL